MKIVFFSHDDELEEFLQDAQTSADVVMTDAFKDAVAEVEDALDEELPVALFLDFDTSRKDSEKLNKQYLKNKEVCRIVFTESMSVKELKKHQDSKLGANAYMRKPLGAEAISELLQDLGLADEAVFDYESDELFDSIPVGSESSADENEESSSSHSGVDFSAAEMKMDTHVRYQLDRHNLQSDQVFDFKSEANIRIQAIFDSALGQADELGEQEEQESDYEIETNLADEQGLDVLEDSEHGDADESIVFDFAESSDTEEVDAPEGELMTQHDDSDESENTLDVLEQMESDREASLVGYRPPTLEPTGDIEIPDEFRKAAAKSEEDSEDLLASMVEEDNSEVDGGLEFAMPDGSPASEDEANSLELGDSEDEGDLSFDITENDDLALGDENGGEELSMDAASDPGMDLSMDDDGGALEFSSSDEFEAADDAETSEEVGGLDLGEDGGDLELGAGDDDAATEDDDFGALDLSESDDEEIEKTVVMSGDDGALNFDMGAEAEANEAPSEEYMDTSDVNFSSDLSESDLEGVEDEELLAGGEEVNLDDALSGVTEESLEEFDYTGADLEAGAELDEDEFSDLIGSEAPSEGTDPTILASITDEDATLNDFNEFQVPASDDSEASLEASEDELLGDDDFAELSGEGADFSATSAIKDEQALGASAPVARSSSSRPAQTRASSDPILVQTYAEEEMVRHQGLIKQLREEREDLLKQITDLKTSLRLAESENLGLRAELDELKIEKSIMKKRSLQELEEMRYSLKLADEKREIFEERARKIQKEFDKLNHKVRIDFNTVKQREKELEGQLELLKMDSRSQVESRDKKILELKRKIDALEFNMENAHIKEQKSKEDKIKLEDKLHKVMKTLRSSIKVMEDDLEIDNLLGESYDSSSEGEATE